MSARPLVSAVVVAYRQREPLVQCLRALAVAAERLEAEQPARGVTEEGEAFELIVVDNGGLAELVLEHSPAARVLRSEGNVGFAAAAQAGIEAARGEWVALINDDATLEPGALAALVAAGRSSPRVGAVAAQIRFEGQPGLINSAGIDVDSLGVASERLAGRPVAAAQNPGEVFGASACVALYRAEMLAQLDGLDGRFFAYQEDVDLAWRARAGGWRAVYEPGAIAYHRGSASTGEGSAAKYYLVGRNRVWLLARNATTSQLLRALPGILLYDLAYVLFVALSDRTLAPLRGRAAGLRSWGAKRAERRGRRSEIALSSARSGWLGALRQHLAYRSSTGA
ncbi:MAG: glycosyltransferase family 2 protein [Solirubrobacteraceae bacterium]